MDLFITPSYKTKHTEANAIASEYLKNVSGKNLRRLHQADVVAIHQIGTMYSLCTIIKNRRGKDGFQLALQQLPSLMVNQRKMPRKKKKATKKQLTKTVNQYIKNL